jgi:transcriptional regulator with XRE-family HTH domain
VSAPAIPLFPTDSLDASVDAHIGRLVRLRRNILGMSQEKLAESLGVTFQQVQKYERGTNRIAASRLFGIAKALQVPVSFFFESILATPDYGQSPINTTAMAADDMISAYQPDPLAQEETLRLIRAYYKIVDPKQRQLVLDLIEGMNG